MRAPRVLVVDDEAPMRRALSRQMASMGYAAEAVDSVDAALEAIGRAAYAGVLCDLYLPGKNGTALLAELERRGVALTVVMMSGRATSTDVVDCYRYGARDVLVKPFTRLELASVLAHFGEPGPGGPVAVFRDPALRLATVAGAEEPSAREAHRTMHRIANWTRVLQILRRAAKGARGRILFEEGAEGIEVVFQSLSTMAGDADAGFVLSLLPEDPSKSFAGLPWSLGKSCAVWFADPTGIHGFRSKVLGGEDEMLLVEQPAYIVRYTRRSCERAEPREGQHPTLVFRLSDGSEWTAHESVVDISCGGLAVRVPVDLEPAVGDRIRFALQLEASDTRRDVEAIVRRVANPNREGFVVLGLEFVDLPYPKRVAIERYVEKLLRSRSDEFLLMATPVPRSLPDI